MAANFNNRDVREYKAINIDVMPTQIPNNFQLRNSDNSVQKYKRMRLTMLLTQLKKEIEIQKCEKIISNDPSIIIKECINFTLSIFVSYTIILNLSRYII